MEPHPKTLAPKTLGRTSDGAGLRGSPIGGSEPIGAWGETRFDLSRFRGRSIRIRFLASTLKIGDRLDYGDAGWPESETADDGWYIDNGRARSTLAATSTVTNDDADNGHLPACSPGCTVVTADL